ncbi:hypothetical protein DFJ73DRAFT_875174 [Zopfochytrium polystomum]|nr:hypothetical protein DFJ73DRAFT_875174 [Zopfochytrium polystomum]
MPSSPLPSSAAMPAAAAAVARSHPRQGRIAKSRTLQSRSRRRQAAANATKPPATTAHQNAASDTETEPETDNETLREAPRDETAAPPTCPSTVSTEPPAVPAEPTSGSSLNASTRCFLAEHAKPVQGRGAVEYCCLEAYLIAMRRLEETGKNPVEKEKGRKRRRGEESKSKGKEMSRRATTRIMSFRGCWPLLCISGSHPTRRTTTRIKRAGRTVPGGSTAAHDSSCLTVVVGALARAPRHRN